MKIIFDIFPAHLQVAPKGLLEDINDLRSYPKQDGAYYVSTARVILMDVDDYRLIIVASDSPEGAQIVFQEKVLESFIPNNANTLNKPEEIGRVITVSGKALAFSKDTNCGCGSRLRSWNPYRTIQSIKDPSV